jgi:hypothetical protein
LTSGLRTPSALAAAPVPLPWGSPDLQGLECPSTDQGGGLTSRGAVVAGCWLPAPSMALSVAGRAFEVFRRPRADVHPLAGGPPCGPSGLGSPSELDRVARVGSLRPSSLGVRAGGGPQDVRPRAAPHRPSTDNPSERPLPRTSPGASDSRGPLSNSCSVFLVLRQLDGFLRSEVAGLLHPAAGPGVRRVSRSRVPSESRPKRKLVGVPRRSSRRSSHPSKKSPRLQPHHVTVAVAPLPLAPTTPGPLAPPPLPGWGLWVGGWEPRLRGFAPLSSP